MDAAQECIELIDAIGTVTADSGDAIAAARDAYDALTEVAKGLVTNYSVLTAAESSFTKVSSDVDKAAPVIAMIEKLPQTVTLKDRDTVTEALNAYLDLYPRTRKYVTNYDKLAAAVETIEALAPGANLAHDTLNNRTQGQTEDTPAESIRSADARYRGMRSGDLHCGLPAVCFRIGSGDQKKKEKSIGLWTKGWRQSPPSLSYVSCNRREENMMKIDLHVHCLPASPCAAIQPEELPGCIKKQDWTGLC